MLTDKIIRHTKGWRIALSVFFIIAFLPLGLDHLIQYMSPTDRYYVYDSDEPVTILGGNFAGGELEVKSNACFLGDGILMTWFDTVFCDDKKYDTQKWVDFQPPGCTIDSDEFWTYRLKEFTGEEEKCTLRGYMYGTTPLGYKKESSYSIDFTLDGNN